MSALASAATGFTFNPEIFDVIEVFNFNDRSIHFYTINITMYACFFHRWMHSTNASSKTIFQQQQMIRGLFFLWVVSSIFVTNHYVSEMSLGTRMPRKDFSLPQKPSILLEITLRKNISSKH